MELYKTERLIIRRFKESDALYFFEYMNRPRVHCFMMDRLSNLEEAQADVQKRSKDKSQFAVCLQSNDVLIGNLFAMKEGDTYNVGWNFNSNFEGKGYATEAARGLFDYLYYSKNARRIYCYVEDYNVRSQQLCNRLGMRQEGLFIEYISFVKDDAGMKKYENTLQFALLKKEWSQAKS